MRWRIVCLCKHLTTPDQSEQENKASWRHDHTDVEPVLAHTLKNAWTRRAEGIESLVGVEVRVQY
jgi:hypothetical protein